MTRRNLTGLAVAVALGVVAAADGQPGQGIHIGQWALRPFVEFQGVYDSNINQAQANPKDDVFLDSILGLRAGYTAYELDVSGLGFLSARSYAEAGEKEYDAAGEILKVKFGARDRLLIEADQSFRRIEDNDTYAAEAAVGGVSPDSVLDASSRDRRSVNQVGVSVGRELTDKMEVDAGYRFDTLDYERPGLLDQSSHAVQIETARKLTDKTSSLLTIKGGIQDADTVDGSSDYYAARIGLKTRGTDKVTLKAGVGAQWYDRSGDRETESGVHYDVAAMWLATDKMSVQAGGRNGVQLSSVYAGNAAEFSSMWLGASYGVTRSMVLSATGIYRVDDYLDPILANNVTVEREDKGLAFRVRADYQTPAKFMRIFCDVTHEAVDSNVSDYDEDRVGVGLQFHY